MKISQKIILSFSILFLTTASVLLLMNFKVREMNALAQESLEVDVIVKDYIDDLLLDFTQYFATGEILLSQIDQRALDDYYAEIKALEENISQELKNPPVQKNKYEFFINNTHLMTLLGELSQYTKRSYTLMQSFAQLQATEHHAKNIEPIKKEIIALLEETNKAISHRIVNDRDLFNAHTQDIFIIQLLSTSLIFVIVMIISLLILKTVIYPIKTMTAFLSDVKHADDIPYQDRKDEIGRFASAFYKVMNQRDEAEFMLGQKATEREWALSQANESNEAKTAFLANISHELRTPLNSILGMSQLIKKDKLDAKTKQKFENIEKSSGLLLALVNDILDAAKLDAKQVELEYIEFDLLNEIETIYKRLEPLAANKSVSLKLNELNKPESSMVMGDPLRFSSILTNLIGNAIRYTEEGSIKIDVKFETYNEAFEKIYVDVVDTGIGIPEDKLDVIFEKFGQADASNKRKYGGTGLGLAITRELVELMGGDIFVESKLGEGSRFSFYIPFLKAQDSETKNTEQNADQVIRTVETMDIVGGLRELVSKSRPNIRQAKILFVDDNDMNHIVMAAVFDEINAHNVTMVKDGRQAFDKFKDEHFDLIFMDCHMPNMNGYEATQAIRNLSDDHKKHIPIIAMTGDGMNDNEQKCQDAGMNDFILKPFNLDDLITKAGRWIEFESQSA